MNQATTDVRVTRTGLRASIVPVPGRSGDFVTVQALDGLYMYGPASLADALASEEYGAFETRGEAESACREDACREEDPQRQTNVEFVNELMNFSRHGALVQIFILQALGEYSKALASKDPDALQAEWGPTSMISAHAWVGVAREVFERVSAHLDPAPPSPSKRSS